jgi:subtilisin-like proprotein convertase family protein
MRTLDLAGDELYVQRRNGQGWLQQTGPYTSFERVRQSAEALSGAGDKEAALVLYEVGTPRNEFARRVLTRRILVRARPGTDPIPIARRLGLVYRGEIEYLPGCFIFETPKPGSALALAATLSGRGGILSAQPLLGRRQALRFIPNDSLFSDQWHLQNTGQTGGTPGIDLNVVGAWDTCRGSGVTAAVVDTGVQYTHPDLISNVNGSLQWDWIGNDSDPSPDDMSEAHGTCCAGLLGAQGNNGSGVAGVSFNGALVCLRLLTEYSFPTDDMEAAAIFHRNDVISVKSYSWGPADDGRTVEGPGPLALAALEESARTGRNGFGVIHVWAGGNGRANGDNQNYDGYVNSIYTISVAACDDQGYQASYSEPGACIVVTAPSSSSGRAGITTTDLVGNYGSSPSDYTSAFGGTSTGAPQVAGVVALMLEVNPNLGWRDVQEILMRSARKINPQDTDWITNAAGLHFNHRFGAGLVDAAAALSLAGLWANLGTWTNIVAEQTGLTLSIPDNDPTGVTLSFPIAIPHFRVEHVTVTVNIAHPRRGDLEITLTSPGGTQSRLAELHNDSGADFPNWKFMSLRNWGEEAQGQWTVTVADRLAHKLGTLNLVRLGIFGTLVHNPPIVTTSPGAASYVENASPVAIDPELTVTDPDDSSLVGATVTITEGFEPGFDVLGFSPQAGIAGQYDAGSGILTLNGTASVSEYEAALRSVTYCSTSDGPSPTQRTITFVAQDASATGSGTRPLDVIPVNDPPGFQKGNDVALPQNAGPQELPGWATSISPGPGEPGQTVQFLVSADKPYLFSAPPAVDASGTLIFTPARNMRGTALVTVQLQDSGGVENGGVDTSEPQFFTITVGQETDTDEDGLPDDWEEAYFGGTSALADDDMDGDGFSNLQEFEAGTDPVDPADAPGITSTEPSANDVIVSFKTVIGKSYLVEWSDNPIGLSWSPIPTGAVQGTGSIVSVTHQDAGALSGCYYRVKVLP